MAESWIKQQMRLWRSQDAVERERQDAVERERRNVQVDQVREHSAVDTLHAAPAECSCEKPILPMSRVQSGDVDQRAILRSALDRLRIQPGAPRIRTPPEETPRHPDAPTIERLPARRAPIQQERPSAIEALVQRDYQRAARVYGTSSSTPTSTVAQHDLEASSIEKAIQRDYGTGVREQARTPREREPGINVQALPFPVPTPFPNAELVPMGLTEAELPDIAVGTTITQDMNAINTLVTTIRGAMPAGLNLFVRQAQTGRRGTALGFWANLPRNAQDIADELSKLSDELGFRFWFKRAFAKHLIQLSAPPGVTPIDLLFEKGTFVYQEAVPTAPGSTLPGAEPRTVNRTASNRITTLLLTPLGVLTIRETLYADRGGSLRSLVMSNQIGAIDRPGAWFGQTSLGTRLANALNFQVGQDQPRYDEDAWSFGNVGMILGGFSLVASTASGPRVGFSASVIVQVGSQRWRDGLVILRVAIPTQGVNITNSTFLYTSNDPGLSSLQNPFDYPFRLSESGSNLVFFRLDFPPKAVVGATFRWSVKIAVLDQFGTITASGIGSISVVIRPEGQGQEVVVGAPGTGLISQ
jgi:hypothetical protein